jgi:hypothetical protein
MFTRRRRGSGRPPHRSAHQCSVAVLTMETEPMSWWHVGFRRDPDSRAHLVRQPPVQALVARVPAVAPTSHDNPASGLGMRRKLEHSITPPEPARVLAGCEAALIVLDRVPPVSDQSTGIELGLAERLTAHRLHRIPAQGNHRDRHTQTLRSPGKPSLIGTKAPTQFRRAQVADRESHGGVRSDAHHRPSSGDLEVRAAGYKSERDLTT